MAPQSNSPVPNRFVEVRTADGQEVRCLLPRPGDGGWPYTLEMLDRIARADGSVLITGETGTGKELLAAYLHGRSRRAKGPLVSVNCAGLTEERMQGELFGWRKGAFTGADRDYAGKVEAAAGGTLFLDEIGHMDPLNQARLLRFMQTKQIERLGEVQPIAVDARVIAATNRPVVARGAGERQVTFLPDLFYRFRHSDLQLPPLRDRGDDIFRLLVSPGFLGDGGLFTGIRLRTLALMAFHTWPGNIRELARVCDDARLFHGCREGDPAPPQHIFTPQGLLPQEAVDAFGVLVRVWLKNATNKLKEWGSSPPEWGTALKDTACLLAALLPLRSDATPIAGEQDAIPLGVLRHMLDTRVYGTPGPFAIGMAPGGSRPRSVRWVWRAVLNGEAPCGGLLDVLDMLCGQGSSGEWADWEQRFGRQEPDKAVVQSLLKGGFSFGGWGQPVAPGRDPRLEERLAALDLSAVPAHRREVVLAVLRHTSLGLSRSQTARALDLNLSHVKAIVDRYGDGFRPSQPSRGGRPRRLPGTQPAGPAP